MKCAERSNASSLQATLAGTCAVAVWLLTSIKIGSNPAIAATLATSILVLVQGFIALISAPILVDHGQRLQVAYGASGIVLIPWPVYALCLQMSGTSLWLLLLTQFLMLVGMLTSYQIALWLQQRLQMHWRNNAVTLLQILPVIGLITAFPLWQPLVVT